MLDDNHKSNEGKIKMIHDTKENKLKALLALTLHIHFSNAHKAWLEDQEEYKKTFARFQNEDLIKILSIFIKDYTAEKAEKILQDTEIAELLEIKQPIKKEKKKPWYRKK